MRKRIAVLLLAIALLGILGVCSANASLGKGPAKRALTKELRRSYEMSFPTINCQKLTASKMHCRFHGLTERDVREGNIGGHSGDAYVTKFRYGTDVRIISYHRG